MPIAYQTHGTPSSRESPPLIVNGPCRDSEKAFLIMGGTPRVIARDEQRLG
jgi:hypothetical protein